MSTNLLIQQRALYGIGLFLDIVGTKSLFRRRFRACGFRASLFGEGLGIVSKGDNLHKACK